MDVNGGGEGGTGNYSISTVLQMSTNNISLVHVKHSKQTLCTLNQEYGFSLIIIYVTNS